MADSANYFFVWIGALVAQVFILSTMIAYGEHITLKGRAHWFYLTTKGEGHIFLNLSSTIYANSSIIFDSLCSYSAQWLHIACRLQQRSLNMGMSWYSRSMSNNLKICLMAHNMNSHQCYVTLESRSICLKAVFHIVTHFFNFVFDVCSFLAQS